MSGTIGNAACYFVDRHRASALFASSVLVHSLKQNVKEMVGKWKYPRWIEIVDDLPKTATGKIQRFKLKEAREQST